MNKYVGTSVSFCMKRLLTDEVELSQVAFVVANFDYSHFDNFEEVFDRYWPIYWKPIAEFKGMTREDTLRFLSKVEIKNRPEGVSAPYSREGRVFLPEQTWERDWKNLEARVANVRMDFECNRGACDARNAVCIHDDTDKRYCPRCARKINFHFDPTEETQLVHFPKKTEPDYEIRTRYQRNYSAYLRDKYHANPSS